MTAHPIAAFSITCDRCGEQFEDGDFTIFCADSDLNYDDHDWWLRVNDAHQEEHYCPRCWTGHWPCDEDPEGVDELVHTVKPIPEPHPIVRNPRWTSPHATPGETCVADGCGLRASHDVHTAGA